MEGSSGRFTDEQIVDWLIDECRDAGNRISAVATSGDRIFAIGATVIALTATVAIGGGRGHLLMWLPLAVSIIMVYGLYLNDMVRSLIGYKIVLEEEIERRVGVPVIVWQSRISGSTSRPHTRSVAALGGVVYAVSIGLGLAQALRTLTPGAWGHESAWVYISLTAASVVAGLGLIGYCFHMQRNSTRGARRLMEDLFAGARRENS